MKHTAILLATISYYVGTLAHGCPERYTGIASSARNCITYQGRLTNSSGAVNGTCDLEFKLYDDAAAGTQIGSTQTKTNVTVTNGVFTVALDFGVSAFNGDARWLAISVRCPAGSGSYTPLTPRQPLTPAPYALALPGLWTQPNTTSPNLIGGFSGNSITSGVIGAAIGGGGDNAFPNRVIDDYGVVSGGYNNRAGDAAGTTNDKSYATVGGGVSNTASGDGATIAGGGYSVASGGGATIGGGNGNSAASSYSTIGGGIGNNASGDGSTIGGGNQNTTSSSHATVGGGDQNAAGGVFATVPGGSHAVATNYGQMAYASGSFAVPGDAQTSIYVLRNVTGSSSSVELFLNGGTEQITISNDRTVVFEALIVGRRTDGASADFRLSGVIANVGGTTSLVGVTPLESLGSSTPNYGYVDCVRTR